MVLRLCAMPEISRFYGIVIRVNWQDHPPPHVHATYGSYRALIAVDSPRILNGWLPPRARGLVLLWAHLHRDELIEAWELARMHIHPDPIEPLE